MQYRELVKKVQHFSGFSDKESETALRLFVETLATRLTVGERKDFASQLPQDLKELALSVDTTEKLSADDFIQQFCETEDISEGRAKKQILSVWQALKAALSPGEVGHIKAQLPRDLAMTLH